MFNPTGLSVVLPSHNLQKACACRQPYCMEQLSSISMPVSCQAFGSLAPPHILTDPLLTHPCGFPPPPCTGAPGADGPAEGSC
jgi:hypothetical protein